MELEAAQERAPRRESNRELSARTQRFVVLVNVALAGSKLAVGGLAGSPALVANGIENLTDLLSNAVGWIGHRVAQQPPDEDHHYGHGNAEALAAVGIGLLILGGGGGIVWRTLAEGGRVEADLTGGMALGVALASAGVCEWVSRRAARAARATGSQVLVALARDKRSDALTSLVVVVGLGGSLLGLGWIEPAVAVLMGGLIAFMGLRSVLEGLDVLMDRVRDPSLRDDLRAIAAEVPGVRGVQTVRVHPLGATFRVDLEIGVDGDLSVRRGHEIAHEVERTIRRERDRVVQVLVHVNPR